MKSWNQSCAAVIDVYGNPIEFVMKKRGQLFSRRHVFRMTPRDAGILAADLITAVLMSGYSLEPDHPLAKRFRMMRGDPPSNALD